MPHVAEIDLNTGLVDESVGSEGRLLIRPLFPTNKGMPNVAEADLDKGLYEREVSSPKESDEIDRIKLLFPLCCR
jgi:hypothetical protein